MNPFIPSLCLLPGVSAVLVVTEAILVHPAMRPLVVDLLTGEAHELADVGEFLAPSTVTFSMRFFA